MGKDVDAADDRRVDLPGVERPHRLVEGDQRGGTGGVDRHARAAEAEDVRDAVGDDRQGVAGHEVRASRGRILDRQVGVVEARCADIDTDVFAVQRRRRDVGVFKRPPGKLEQHALLRVHIHGLALRHAEDGRIEIIELIQHAGREGIGLPLRAHDGMPESRHVPAIRWNAGDGALALT